MGRGPFSPGDQCNQYRIVKPLGTGGYGCVYEAVREFQIMARGVMQPFLQRVALKCLQVDRARDAKKIERMNLEAILLMDLKHDNIVGFLDWGISDAGVFYFAMDLLQGKTLADHVGAGRFSVTRSLYVATEVAAGLAYAHEKHIMHRDLKPSNVFVTDRWEIKVLDLGAAKHDLFGGISTTTGKAPCTVTYAAPEQLDGSGAVDQRADLFALGVITYQMLAGEHPFSSGARTPAEYAMRQFEGRYKPLSEFGIPKYVAKVVHRALSKNPKDRYANAYEMLNDLRAAFIRHKETKRTREDRDVEDIVERRRLRAHLERGDESDPNGRAVGRGAVARRGEAMEAAGHAPVRARIESNGSLALDIETDRLVAPERVKTVLISDYPELPLDSLPSAQSRNGHAPSSMHDRATHTASNRADASASRDTLEEPRTDEPTGGRGRRRRRMSFLVLGWAMSLLIVALCWIIFAGPRPSDVRAQQAMPAQQGAPAMKAASPPATAADPPSSNSPEIALREQSPKVVQPIAPPGVPTSAAAPSAVAEAAMAAPSSAASVAIRKPTRGTASAGSKKRPSPVPDGIHVPKWDSLTDPFAGEALPDDESGEHPTLRRP